MKRIPFDFVLHELEALKPQTRPMFGCHAVYVENKIVLILRDRPSHADDNGVWLATTKDHHKSLKRDFPSMRSIGVFGTEISAWQVLPADADDFEDSVLRACEMVLNKDPRIGKVPEQKRKAQKKKSTTQKLKAKKLPTIGRLLRR